MPKVIITPSSIFNPIGVRLLLGEVGVIGPMLQDETTITCMMTEAQIERFRNGRGAAHKVEIVPDVPINPVTDCLPHDGVVAKISIEENGTPTPIVDVIDSENDDERENPEQQESDEEPPAQDPISPNDGGGDSGTEGSDSDLPPAA